LADTRREGGVVKHAETSRPGIGWQLPRHLVDPQQVDVKQGHRRDEHRQRRRADGHDEVGCVGNRHQSGWDAVGRPNGLDWVA
jgi:hypothetical protein